MAKKSSYNTSGSKSGSGPTRTAGHIDSVMGSQYPRGMGTHRTGGTGSKRKK